MKYKKAYITPTTEGIHFRLGSPVYQLFIGSDTTIYNDAKSAVNDDTGLWDDEWPTYKSPWDDSESESE